VDIPPPPPPPPLGDEPPHDQKPSAHPAGPPPYGYPQDAGPSYGYPQAAPYGPPPAYGQPQQPPGYGANPYQQNPYAAPGPPGYPAAPGYPGAPGVPGYPQPYPQYPGQQGWFAVERTTNGLAIASLVTAFTCIPFLALGLGIGGLRQIKRRGQRGRGLAIAGVTLGSIGTALIALFVVLGVTGVFDEGNTKVADIKAGQCFNTVGRHLSQYGDGGKVSTTVDVVDCGKAHDAEAYDVFPVDSATGAYPGVPVISGEASAKCAAAAEDYLDGKTLPAGMGYFSYIPPASAWARGDHSVTCFFGSPGGKVTGSVRSGVTGGGSDGGSDGGPDGGGSDGGVGV